MAALKKGTPRVVGQAFWRCHRGVALEEVIALYDNGFIIGMCALVIAAAHALIDLAAWLSSRNAGIKVTPLTQLDDLRPEDRDAFKNCIRIRVMKSGEGSVTIEKVGALFRVGCKVERRWKNIQPTRLEVNEPVTMTFPLDEADKRILLGVCVEDTHDRRHDGFLNLRNRYSVKIAPKIERLIHDP